MAKEALYREISKCRLCKNEQLEPIVSLGDQALTGVFPSTKNEKVPSGPLELIKCNDEKNTQTCGLLQLKHSFEVNKLYGNNYGYRSGINQTMSAHLKGIVEDTLKWVTLESGDVVLDIGSNDGTLLKSYPFNKEKRSGNYYKDQSIKGVYKKCSFK